MITYEQALPTPSSHPTSACHTTRPIARSRDRSSSSHPYTPVHTRGPSSDGSRGGSGVRGGSARQVATRPKDVSGRIGRKRRSSRDGPGPGVPLLPGASAGSSGAVLREPGGPPALFGPVRSIQDHHSLAEGRIVAFEAVVGHLDENIGDILIEDVLHEARERQKCRRVIPSPARLDPTRGRGFRLSPGSPRAEGRPDGRRADTSRHLIFGVTTDVRLAIGSRRTAGSRVACRVTSRAPSFPGASRRKGRHWCQCATPPAPTGGRSKRTCGRRTPSCSFRLRLDMKIPWLSSARADGVRSKRPWPVVGMQP